MAISFVKGNPSIPLVKNFSEFYIPVSYTLKCKNETFEQFVIEVNMKK